MAAIELPPVIQAKPFFGQSCNGCGLCCVREICQIGKKIHGEIQAPCPSLFFERGRFWCAVVRAEEIAGLRPIIRNALAIGKGCDSEMWEELAD